MPRTTPPSLTPDATFMSHVPFHSAIDKGLPECPPGSSASTTRPPLTESAASTSVSSSSDSWPVVDTQTPSREHLAISAAPLVTATSPASVQSPASALPPQAPQQPRLGLHQQEPRAIRGASGH